VPKRHDPAEIRDKIGDRRVVASVSGGKDSTAMCLYLQDLGVEYTPVFMDTGWEHQDTYTYLREVLPEHIGEILWLRGEFNLRPELVALAEGYEKRLGMDYSAMVRAIFKKAMFPSRVRRFCTEKTKVFVMADYLKALDEEPINTVGIRGAESFKRSQMPEWESNQTFDCDVWRPILSWTEDEVVEIHRDHGVPPNRQYLKGAARVGCWPCIFARKHEIRMIAEISPERIAILRDLEHDVARLAEERYAARGETFESLGYHAPTWFQSPVSRPDPETGVRSGETWPIDKVLEWARTKYGGGEEEPFAPLPHEAGCMRWGFCDKSWSGAKEPDRDNVLTLFEQVDEDEQAWRDKMAAVAKGEEGPE
jgi:3'-phosphoadenosine 5'-phosphosulfate sulfotransferase (PAPS reductase)/FAD synthetase